MRLPKGVESEPRYAGLAAGLESRAEALWPGGELRAPRIEFAPRIESALQGALETGQIVRGLEGAERALALEERGLRNVDQKTGVARGGRVSRLLVLADDGAQRFYRNVEELLRRHAPRVLALRLCTDERALGELLFGPEQVARLLLVKHKDAVTAVLLALAQEWAEAGHD